MITDTAGDVHARNMVRLRELYVSFAVIDNILNGLPEGPIVTESKALPMVKQLSVWKHLVVNYSIMLKETKPRF